MSHTVCCIEDCDLDFELAAEAVRQVAPRAEVLRAISCQEATPLIAEHPPALVLLDLRLPRCNGTDWLHQFSTSGKPLLPDWVVVVVFTTSTSPGDRRDALAAGAKDFVSKPMDPRLYLAAVREVVQTWLN
ncbi:Polar-differentiation response regulator DivK [Posidoniimonas corsicana]|uniref:Polar-differentiation response regulator DivK n=1 Tax=Posidoniimonas corsicana TaxID=1938618 RepID=A0A5C5VHX9_9BACT|nr:response regulator [Posidoniimonas corsicana]TWT37613.1 Polar-differentiation response regulator DivK [Posidoniimonas corsicana]